MSKRIWSIALAYVGVMIGAGVSSGQDLLQYFVSFGAWGLIGVIVLGILHVGFGRLMIALGSYYRSDDHSVVLAEISHPVIYRILDIALIITCFLFGFVMTAGAGANLNQQFGFPIWVQGLKEGAPIHENYGTHTGELLKAPHFSWSSSHLLMLYDDYGK